MLFKGKYRPKTLTEEIALWQLAKMYEFRVREENEIVNTVFSFGTVA